MNRQIHSQRGYALMAVLGVMALLVVYVATIQGSLGVQVAQTKIAAKRLDRQEAFAQAVALYGQSDAVTSGTLAVASTGQKLRVERRALSAQDPVWARARGTQALPGDALLHLTWEDAGPGAAERWCIVNTQGRRQGALVLARP